MHGPIRRSATTSTWRRARVRGATRPPPCQGRATSTTSTASARRAARPATASQGYYSYDVGTWHLIALNSNCPKVGGCGAGSPAGAWLRADLAAHPAACTLAYWHHPRFSSGEHGGNAMRRAASGTPSTTAGADVVLNGHDHDYERFAPQTPPASPTRTRHPRVRGRHRRREPLRVRTAIKPNSEVQQQRHLRRAEADAARAAVRLAVRARGRQDASRTPAAAPATERRGSIMHSTDRSFGSCRDSRAAS